MSTKTIGNTAVELVPENSQRKSFAFQNEDTTDSIFLKKERPGLLTVSATDHDYKLFPGAVLPLNFQSDGEEAIQGRWTAISSANTPRIAFVETENIRR